MFLNELNEEIKELFLQVCVYAAESNGIFAEEQKGMIGAYCREMNIRETIPTINISLSELLSKVSEKSDKRERNIIFLEILGLIKSDGIYDEEEQEFMELLRKELFIEKDVADKIEELLGSYLKITTDLYKAIFI